MILSCLSIGPGPSVSALFAEQIERQVAYVGRERSHRRWTNRPQYRLEKSLRLFDIERFPLDAGFQSVTDRLLRRLGDVRDKVGEDGELRLLAECSSYTYGQPLARRLREIRALHFGFTYSAPMEVVSEEFAGVRPDGWRTRVSRRTVASALDDVSRAGRLKLEVAGPLAAELKAQVKEFSQRPQRAADEPAPTEDLVLGLGLLCFSLDHSPQPGRVLSVTFSGPETPMKPMSRHELLYGDEP